MAKLNNHKDNISLDDATLIRQCQNGDLEAMSCLIVKYQDKIVTIDKNH